MRPLIAKSSRGVGDHLSLLQHTKDVVEAVFSLFGAYKAPTRLGLCWSRFFCLEDECTRKNFYANLHASALFHDVGKANVDMQNVLYGDGTGQMLRHEILSLIYLNLPETQKWVCKRSDINWELVSAAVGSHHLQFSDRSFPPMVAGETTQFLFDAPDFEQLIRYIGTQLLIDTLPCMPQYRFWGFVEEESVLPLSEFCSKIRKNWLNDFDYRIASAPESDCARLLRAVKAALIVADGAASGLRRENKQSISEWINSQFEASNSTLQSRESIENIILSRLQKLHSQGKWQAEVSMESAGWNAFQKDCDHLPSRAGLLAPCGAGKTLAAWRWISRRSELPVSRILFLYPTRATATEGFKDYVSFAPESTLLHGTSDFDLDGMFACEDPRSGMIFSGPDPRLFALNHWGKRVFSATIDQFLSFLSYNYSAMCLLPLLADSVVVLDEVHSFDDKMFSAVLQFLRHFDVPVLCMTATLQHGRLSKLNETLGRIYSEKPDDLKKITCTPRYQVHRETKTHLIQLAKSFIAEGKRVLWVVNQVSRAQELTREFSHLDPSQMVCYHSRFRLNDRVDRHKETMAKIHASQKSTLAITTQVCEMSLDIDADVLISEFCAISSAIQRMGRCRRGRDELNIKGPGKVYFYKPDNLEFVYGEDDLRRFDSFLDALTVHEAVSQMHLEDAMEKFGSKEYMAERRSAFLFSGAYSMSGEDSFRDIEEFSVQCVLDEDLEAYLAASKKGQPGFICPVPKKMNPTPDPKLPRYLRLASAKNYDPKTGYWELL